MLYSPLYFYILLKLYWDRGDLGINMLALTEAFKRDQKDLEREINTLPNNLFLYSKKDYKISKRKGILKEDFLEELNKYNILFEQGLLVKGVGNTPSYKPQVKAVINVLMQYIKDYGSVVKINYWSISENGYNEFSRKLNIDLLSVLYSLESRSLLFIHNECFIEHLFEVEVHDKIYNYYKLNSDLEVIELENLPHKEKRYIPRDNIFTGTHHKEVVTQITNHNNSKKNNVLVKKTEVTGVKLGRSYIRDQDNNKLFTISSTEYQLINLLKGFHKTDGINVHNLNIQLKQPTINATRQSIKTLKGKIKKNGIGELMTIIDARQNKGLYRIEIHESS